MALTEMRRAPAEAGTGATYEGDIYTWALEQAALVEQGALARADLTNIAEELRGLARSEYRAYVSALRVVLLHMLKWDHQPERRSRGWVLSIAEHRGQASSDLRDSPGLKSRIGEALADGYRTARLAAARETGLHPRVFAETCPYDLDAVMTRDHPLPETP